MSRRLAFGLPLLLLFGHVCIAQQKAPFSLDEWYIDETVHLGKTLQVALPDLVPQTVKLRDEAAEISQVLGNDIAFASVFRIVDPKLYPEIPGRDGSRLDYAAWKAAGIDVVITGSLSREGDWIVVAVRIHAVGASEMAFQTMYRAPVGEDRRLAHRIADEILAKFGVAGVAQTKIAFASERDRTDAQRRAIYMMDYDGARPTRLTHGFLDLAPRWSPDGASLLYLTFPTRVLPPALVQLVDGEARRTLIAAESMVFPGSWSPDGTRIAFSSTRDGNADIYVMNADGSELQRLTDHPAIDVSPTWSPTGRELAFTSDRSGSPQIYTMDRDGLNVTRISKAGSYNAEPAWSPSTQFSEIAYASRVEGGVFDIVVLDLLTKQVRQLTSQRSLNESPSWAPNGRHLVFSSTRTGEPQIFTINRDGSNVRQLTFADRNTTPSWSTKN
jgi:TolB protein